MAVYVVAGIWHSFYKRLAQLNLIFFWLQKLIIFTCLHLVYRCNSAAKCYYLFFPCNGLLYLTFAWLYQDAKKGVLFIDFPPVLQLQLKRFEYDFMRDTMVKVSSFVTISFCVTSSFLCLISINIYPIYYKSSITHLSEPAKLYYEHRVLVFS